MTLRVVGAGLPRTGTNSLKLALELLLGGPCYHMLELFERPRDVATWSRATAGESIDWDRLFDGFTAAVDWPASAFWTEQADAFPDALVLLSSRDDPETWWRSMDATVMRQRREMPVDLPPEQPMAAFGRLMSDMSARFWPQGQSPDAMMTAYEQHNAAVRATVAAGRLVDWRPGAGWEPLCSALRLPVPDEPFPNVNSTAEFTARARQGPPGGRPSAAPTSTG